MDLSEQTHRVTFMIRDHGSNFTAAFDAVLADAGIRTVLCNVRTPRMNAIAERWIGGCRRELLDRTLIWNQHHLRRILRDYETHHNQHRPHRSLHAAAPLPARRRAAETATRAGRSRSVPRPTTHSRGAVSVYLPMRTSAVVMLSGPPASIAAFHSSSTASPSWCRRSTSSSTSAGTGSVRPSVQTR